MSWAAVASWNYGDNTYEAALVRTIDGDTVELDVDLGLRVHRTLYVRLVGINAPEVRGPEKAAGLAAEAHLRTILDGNRIRVSFEKGKSFDRWLGKLYVKDVRDDVDRFLDVQAIMVEAGHATWSDA